MASANSSDFENSPAAKSAAIALKEVASLVLRGVQTIKSDHLGRPAIPRSQIIHSCKDLIEAQAGTLVRVEELAAKASVSERTLRQVFYDFFGIGPARYLQLRQVHQVHRELRKADPKTTRISNVLTKHGIWEFGRFASRYRRLFGELPSQTLRTTFHRANEMQEPPQPRSSEGDQAGRAADFIDTIGQKLTSAGEFGTTALRR